MVVGILEKLVQLQETYRQQGRRFRFHRFLFEELKRENNLPHITGISGLRGSGKTVLLLQLLNSLPKSFYISLDTIENADLFALAKELVERYGIKTLLLDEIHYLPRWSLYLKQIYDILDVKVFFTSSVSLDILKVREDLSRRVKILNLPVLSFREYLALARGKKVRKMDLDTACQTFEADPELESYFSDYLMYPLPSQIEDKTPQLILNIIERILSKDLAGEHALTLSEQMQLKQILEFLSQIPGGDISVSQLAQNFKVSKYKMGRLLELLEKAFLIQRVWPIGRNVLKEPKILLNLPFRYYLSGREFSEVIGAFKEDFLVSQLKALGIKVGYLKTKRGRKAPDFYISWEGKEYVIEVRGRAKGGGQFKGIEVKNKILALYPFAPKPSAVPLYVFGLLY